MKLLHVGRLASAIGTRRAITLSLYPARRREKEGEAIHRKEMALNCQKQYFRILSNPQALDTNGLWGEDYSHVFHYVR
jgi:hypothetical protein